MKNRVLFTVRLLLTALLLAGLFAFWSPAQPIAHAAGYSVLFDNFHAETAGNSDWVISSSQPDPLQQNANPQNERDWTGGISAWGVALQQTGRYSLKTNTRTFSYGDSSNPLDLSRFNVLVLPEPNSLLTSGEKTAILNFVRNGGGLFMIADHNGSDRNNDGADSLRVLNDLMNNGGAGSNVFGIQFDVVNISNENPSNDTPNPDPILQGSFGTARSSIIRAGTTETLDPAANPAAHGVIYRNSASNTGNTGAFVSRSSYGSGRIVAVGDSSAIDDGTCASSNNCFNGWNDPAGNNSILFPNATDWLAGSGGSAATATNTPSIPTATRTPIAVTATNTPVAPTATSTAILPTATNTPLAPTATRTPLVPTATPTPGSGSQQLIQNGGFESGSSPWVESSSGGYETVDPARPHTGSNSAYLCGYNNCADSIYQTVTVPAVASSVSLSYYWQMSTQETSHPYDYLYVRVRSSSGANLANLQTVTDGSSAGNWAVASYDLSSYRGQTIQIAFAATSDSSATTSFFIDDVSLISR